MPILLRRDDIWIDTHGHRLSFNPLECPILRTEKAVGYFGLGSYDDLDGNEWDVYKIVGHLVWCTPKNTMQDWYYSTSINRGISSMSVTSNGPDVQQWNAHINISKNKDPEGILTPEDIYLEYYSKVEK